MWTENFQMYKLDLEKEEEPEVKSSTFTGSWRKQGNLKIYIYLWFINYVKVFDCVDDNKDGNTLPASWETCMQVKKQWLEPDMEQWTGSNLGKEYVKVAYCHPAYLTYMQSTSCEILGWMNHKLESRLSGEISTTSDMQMIPL